MSLVVSPSPVLLFGSSLVTIEIVTLAMPTPESQLSLALVIRSVILMVTYLWLGGHNVIVCPVVIVGACVSFTVTLKLQVGPTELVQVTVPQPGPVGAV